MGGKNWKDEASETPGKTERWSLGIEEPRLWMNGYTNGYTSDTGAYEIGRGGGNRIEKKRKRRREKDSLGS